MRLDPIRITAIQQAQPIVQDKEGRPSSYFVRALNDLFGRLAQTINALIVNQNATADAQDSANAAQGFAEAAQSAADSAGMSADAASLAANSALADAATAQAQADAAFALAGTKVTKDQTPAPIYSTYAGQTISAIPTQAEVQALDDAVVSLSSALSSVITKLQAIDVFS